MIEKYNRGSEKKDKRGMETKGGLKENILSWKSRSVGFGSSSNHMSGLFSFCVPFPCTVMSFSGCRCVRCPVTVTEGSEPCLGKQDSWENKLESVSLAHIKELPWRRIAANTALKDVRNASLLKVAHFSLINRGVKSFFMSRKSKCFVFSDTNSSDYDLYINIFPCWLC